MQQNWKIIYSPKILEYRRPLHPESPDRVRRSYEFLPKTGAFEFIEPAPCSDEDILAVHSEKVLRSLKDGSFYDPDTPNLPGILGYAKLSAGAAVLAADLAYKDKKAFSLMRPPGHHAGKDAPMGFCYLNNIAIAAQSILSKVKKISIIDFDCHHGNGTQDIFLGDERVQYISLHQSPCYPGTGLRNEGNCINYTLAPGTEETEYLSLFKKAIERIKDFAPGIVAVSAGFDTYERDPLGNIALEKGSYRKLGNLIAGIGINSFSILEGGYSADLAECIYEYLSGFENS